MPGPFRTRQKPFSKVQTSSADVADGRRCMADSSPFRGGTSMSDKKIIAVVGATGAQGGGLVRAITADKHGPFVARAITRDVNSDKARALVALGAEVVAGDVDDAESLRRAFDGA